MQQNVETLFQLLSHDFRLFQVTSRSPRANLSIRPPSHSAFPSTAQVRCGKVLGRQLLRSGASVGANYREVASSRSKAEFISKLGNCLKEIDESDYWIALIQDESVLPAVKLRSIREETSELVAIFTSTLNTAKRNG